VSDVDAVIELLERWRDATGVGRLRIGLDATRVIAQLPPERKRALAVEVADRVAPQLVPAIRAESGDLSAEQVGALVDLLRRADRDQLDDLVTALREGDVAEAAELVGDAVEVVAPADAGTDELLEDIATEDTAPADTASTEAVDEHAESEDTAPEDTPPAGPGAVPPPPAEPVEQDDDGGVEVAASAAAAAAMADRDDVEVTDDGALALDEEAVREQLQEQARARAAEYRDSSRDVPSRPAYRAPAMDFISDADDELELPDPSVESVAPLRERMVSTTGSRQLAAGPVTAIVASLTATADGYRRRRDALQAIRDGRLAGEDVAPVVASFERATDRAWVAGAAIDAGLVGVDDLAGLDLPASAVARLRRRSR
jgi:hypothetical protein